MSRPALAPERLAPRVAPGIRLLPVVHEALECAALVRALLDRLDPAAVAVELPATLAEGALAAADRLPRVSLVLSEHDDEEPLVWVAAPGEPFAEALRWAGERGRARFLVDPDLPYAERHRDPVPDPYALLGMAPHAYFDLVARAAAGRGGAEDERREAGMAHLVRRARERMGDAGELVVLAGAAHVGGLRSCLEEAERAGVAPFARPRRARVEVRHLHPESLAALLRDAPLAHAAWELLRTGEEIPPTSFEKTLAPRVVLERGGLRLLAGGDRQELADRSAEVARFAARHAARALVRDRPVPDRWALGRAAWRIAAASHREQTEERLAPWQRQTFLDFARRYARVEGRLVPGLFEWLVAGRGVADDNFAWELFDVLQSYPWQEREAEIPTVRVDGDELDLGTRRLRFRLRFRRTKRRPVALPVRRRPRPDDPDDWLRAFEGGGLCSYPPEDLVVEEYGRHLATRARSLLAAERSRSEPFVASLLDGVDLRETLRHRADDGRVWVHERGRAPGAAGAVVVIFDRDRPHGGAERFPFRMTWHGEHHQESDMAFYATDPGAQVVGPGILRATYGGFLLTHPPGRLWDPWRDPDYGFAREKAEVLLAAGIDYSLERLIVYVAPQPPSARLNRHAARQAKRIVYLPLGSLSPATLRKVRVVHLLAGRDTRRIAKEYVW